jgi:hypothetical protein
MPAERFTLPAKTARREAVRLKPGGASGGARPRPYR